MDVAVADGGAVKTNVTPLEVVLDAEVAHHRRDDRLFVSVEGADRQHVVAGNQAA